MQRQKGAHGREGEEKHHERCGRVRNNCGEKRKKIQGQVKAEKIRWRQNGKTEREIGGLPTNKKRKTDTSHTQTILGK